MAIHPGIDGIVIQQHNIHIQTRGRATINLTGEIDSLIRQSGYKTGLCHVYLAHTSASLIITENADRDVRVDLENFMAKLVKDGDPDYFHDQEGPDDMSAHIRSVLTQSEVTLPITQGQAALGTWQGLYLWEHRTQPHRRSLTVTLSGSNT